MVILTRQIGLDTVRMGLVETKLIQMTKKIFTTILTKSPPSKELAKALLQLSLSMILCPSVQLGINERMLTTTDAREPTQDAEHQTSTVSGSLSPYHST